jgi:GT2 family glycosyltransferase
LKQEGETPRILLLDDASTDGSAELAQRIAGDRLVLHRNEKALGIPGNWNRCAALVETEFFCLAHQDDVYAPSYSARMLDALQKDPSAAFAHSMAHGLDKEGSPLASLIEKRKAAYFLKNKNQEGPAALALLFGGNWINCPSMTFRTSAFRDLGGFDSRYHFVSDWEFSLRVLLGGGRIRAVAETLLSYRRHEGQATREAIQGFDRYREELRLLREVEEKARDLEVDLPPGFKAVRNNLLFDTYQDLVLGQKAAARAKLRFGCQELPGFRWDVLALGTRFLAPLGRLGGNILGFGLGIYLR